MPETMEAEAETAVETTPAAEVVTTETSTQDHPDWEVFKRAMEPVEDAETEEAEEAGETKVAEKPRGADGKFVKKDEAKETTPAADAATKEASPDDESTPDAPSTVKIADLSEKAQKLAKELGVETDDEAFDRALRAYKRDPEYDEQEIESKWTADPQRFIERGLAKAQYQAKIDARFSELKGQLATNGTNPKENGKPDGEHQPPVSLSESIKAEIDKLVESIPDGEDDFVSGGNLKQVFGIGLTTIAENMAKFHTGQVQDILKKHESDIAQRDEANRLLSGKLVDLQIEQERNRFLSSNKYTQLSDDAVQEKVLAVYDKLAASDQYDNPAEAYRHAVVSVLGEESENELKARLLKASRAKKSLAPRKPTPAPSKAPEDQDRRAFEKAMRSNSLL